MKFFKIEIFDNPRKRALIIASVLSVIFLIFILFSDFGLFKRVKLKSEEKILTYELEKARAERDSLLKEIDKLKYDTIAIERVAREKYGLIKPHEEVINLVEEDDE